MWTQQQVTSGAEARTAVKFQAEGLVEGKLAWVTFISKSITTLIGSGILKCTSTQENILWMHEH